MPEIAAPAAPAAAPAAAAPSTLTPVSPAAPATPATPVSTPPVTTGTPPAITTSDTPAAPVTPAAPATPEPKAEDFGEDIEAFAKAHWKWEADQDGQPATGVEAPAVPAEAEAPKPGDQAEGEARELHDLPDEPDSLTPESLNALVSAKPEFSALLEADPAVKGALFKMARENAKTHDLMELWPTTELARHDKEVAGRTVDIKNSFLRAEQDPSLIPEAFGKFVDEFTVYENGKPKLDAQGNPVLGKDFELLVQHITDGRMQGSIEQAQERLKAGNLTERQQDRYEGYIGAWKFIQDFDRTNEADLDRPDTDGLDDDSRAHFDRRDAELKKREEDAGLRSKQQDAAAAKQTRQAHDTKVTQTINQGFGERLSQLVKEHQDAGIYIPEWTMQAADPSNPKVSLFLKSVFTQFIDSTVGRFDKESRKWIGGQAKIRADLAQLETLGATDDAANQRVKYFDQLREEYLPNIVNKELRRVQTLDRGKRAKTSAQTDKFRENVQPDVRGGAARSPAPMTAENARAQAEKSVDARFPELDRGEREEKVISESLRLMRHAK